MLKAFLRSALDHTPLENDLAVPADIIPLSEDAQNYEKDREADLHNSFENCVYTKSLSNNFPKDEDLNWSQKTMAEIHQQLLFAFMRSAVCYGIDLDDICVDLEPDEDPDSNNGGIITVSREHAMLRTPDEILAEKIYDFSLELQDCAEECYDEEDEGGGLFEILPGQEDDFIIIRYDYEAMYNALALLSTRLKDHREIDVFLNSAYHVMDLYDSPSLQIN